MGRLLRRTLIALVGFAAMPPISSAVTVVDFPTDCTGIIDSQLSSAISAASSTVSVRILLSAGTCFIQTPQAINGPVTVSIIGAGVDATDIRVSSGSYAIMAGTGTGGVNLDIESMTLQDATNGVIGVISSTLRVDHVRFLNNTGAFGGAIGATAAQVSIRRSSFEGGTAGAGGAIASEGGSGYGLFVQDTTFAGNSSSGNGGAISASVAGILDRVLFSDNHADAGLGGALYMGQSDLTVHNSTFTANSASSGGAIVTDGFGASFAVSLSNITLHGDSASASGSEIFLADSMPDSVTIANSLVGGSCGGFSITPVAHGSIESPGDTCGLPGGSNAVNVTDASLMLGTLANNGGATSTLYPNVGSVLLGAAGNDCEGVDQRDLVRNLAACDVGAVEAGATLPDVIFASGFDN